MKTEQHPAWSPFCVSLGGFVQVLVNNRADEQDKAGWFFKKSFETYTSKMYCMCFSGHPAWCKDTLL
jgi:hypothetical protein